MGPGRLSAAAARLLVLGLTLSGCHRGGSDAAWPSPEGSPWRMVLRAGAGTPASVVLGEGESVPQALRVLGLRASELGAVEADQGTRACGRPRVPLAGAPIDPVVALLGEGPLAEVPRPALNNAAIVEKGQWRVEKLLGEGGGRTKDKNKKKKPQDKGDPGAKDGATPDKPSLRSIVKVRRAAAGPIYVVSGDYGCDMAVAVLDRTARNILASDTFTLAGARCAPLVSVPPADYDGDGALEWIVRSGDGEGGTTAFRGVYRLGFRQEAVDLTRVWGDTLPGQCAGS